MYNRRGTEFVLEAFRTMKMDAELLIHTQHDAVSIDQQNGVSVINGTLPRDMLVALYQESDVAVLPSKWEGLGLTFLEAIGCGLPIITVDAPPMNEFVVDGATGYLVNIDHEKQYPDIFVPGMFPDITDMARKMDALANDGDMCMAMALDELRHEWDWRENFKPLRDLILELGESRGKVGKSNLDRLTTLIQEECSPDALPGADMREYARFRKICADPMVRGDVLDMGCKHGTLAKMLAENFNVTAADSDVNNIDIAVGILGSDVPLFKSVIGSSIPFSDESFDTVILAQVIEHVRDPEGLKELMRVLRPDGCLILTTNVGFAHWDPDHKWFFLPDKTYEMLRGGWFFMESQGQPAFMKQGNVVPFGAFIENYIGESYGYQVYNNHESQYHSLEIYARVYKNDTVLKPFPEMPGDEVVMEDYSSADIQTTHAITAL